MSLKRIALACTRAALVFAACTIASLASIASPAAAQTGAETITVESFSVASEFPEGMRFSIKAEAENEIEEIAVRFRSGTQERQVYGYLEFEQAKAVDSELFWRTDTTRRYIPPGTIIYYHFDIRDAEGNRLVTETSEFIYEDARFTWQEVSDGAVAVAYHGPVKTRAEDILGAITQTIDFMGPILGVDTILPIRVTMYNNVKEMLDALPPGSATIRRELITEGQAYTNVGTLLVLGGGRSANGTASHEVTHILTHRAGDGAARRVPSWLDEGLAEFGNVAPGLSYDIALEFAMATDRLLPITSMPSLPGDPEDVIIFYGQARDLIRFMVFTYGPNAMRERLALHKDGTPLDDAIEDVYGVTRIELENEWRESIGAPLYVRPDRESARPTPIARPAVGLFTLTPQAGAQTVGSLASTPTPMPAPPAVPTPEPATPAPAPTEPPAVSKSASEQTEEKGAEDSGAGGGICSAPSEASWRLTDIAMPLSVLGLVGLGLRRRKD